MSKSLKTDFVKTGEACRILREAFEQSKASFDSFKRGESNKMDLSNEIEYLQKLRAKIEENPMIDTFILDYEWDLLFEELRGWIKEK